jgi:hypothetical protein
MPPRATTAASATNNQALQARFAALTWECNTTLPPLTGGKFVQLLLHLF